MLDLFRGAKSKPQNLRASPFKIEVQKILVQLRWRDGCARQHGVDLTTMMYVVHEDVHQQVAGALHPLPGATPIRGDQAGDIVLLKSIADRQIVPVA